MDRFKKTFKQLEILAAGEQIRRDELEGMAGGRVKPECDRHVAFDAETGRDACLVTAVKRADHIQIDVNCKLLPA